MKGKRTKLTRKAEDKTMDKYLKAILVMLLVFTITMIVVYCCTGGVPDTLVTCVFAAMTGECGFMAIIKSMKVKHEENPKERQQEEPDSAEEDAGGSG